MANLKLINKITLFLVYFYAALTLIIVLAMLFFSIDLWILFWIANFIGIISLSVFIFTLIAINEALEIHIKELCRKISSKEKYEDKSINNNTTVISNIETIVDMSVKNK